MVFLRFGLLFFSAFLLGQVHAAGTNDQISSGVNLGSFQSPSNNVRPRFRYWAPDASVNLTQVADDIRQAAVIGAGGVELLGYYFYGEDNSFSGANKDPLQVDWTIYGWGLSAWKKLLTTVLSTAQQHNLLVDLALGPNQAAGVPAQVDTDGLLWDVAPFNISVPIGGTYDAVLPGWGSGALIAASTGLVVNEVNDTSTLIRTLSSSSLADVTTKVSSKGQLKVIFPQSPKGVEYVVFAYYLKHSEYREVASPAEAPSVIRQSPVTTYQQNGSWVVDHFSAKGAQVTIDFWNQQLLDGVTKDLIKQVGNYIWEDSQEYGTGVKSYWTPQLASQFASRRGYSIKKFIPLVVSSTGTEELFGTAPTVVYATDESDGGISHIVDYQQTLTELNQVYLSTLTDWAQSTLGIQFSAQIAYNLPVDMLANIPSVNAPECESLGFDHNIDGYRQYAGPANLAGKRVISSELGANLLEVFQLFIPDILWDVKRSFAGSVNQFVFHGYPYSGSYPNTTWPTFTAFQYAFSDMHNRHQPGWDFYSDFIGFVSRNNFVAQSGVPKKDVAFWLKSTDYESISTSYAPTDLLSAGYTYEYLSPDNLVALPAAVVSDGVLAPSRQAFKTLVVRSNDNLTSSGVSKLSEYAKAGLPIIFLGGKPSNFEGFDPAAARAVNQTIASISTLKNVHTVASTGLAATLASLGISPRTSVSANGTWYTHWREDYTITYVYVYNDATGIARGQQRTTGTITFATTGTPYTFNAWTGNTSPVPIYQQSGSQTIIPLQLAGNQSVIIAFKHGYQSTPLHIQKASSNSLSFAQTSDAESVTLLRTVDSKAETLTLSTGKTVTLPAMNTPAFTLANWSLTIESWTAPANIEDLTPVATRKNTTYTLPSLIPWTAINGGALATTSGRGYYSTTFTWPPAGSTGLSGAFIDLGAIVHTAQVTINGHVLPPLDVTWARADIGAFLETGKNVVQVVVSTTLGNAVLPLWGTIRTSGKGVEAPPPAIADYGLLDPVVISPYKSITVAA